jgi:hypothetical protein
MICLPINELIHGGYNITVLIQINPLFKLFTYYEVISFQSNVQLSNTNALLVSSDGFEVEPGTDKVKGRVGAFRFLTF